MLLFQLHPQSTCYYFNHTHRSRVIASNNTYSPHALRQKLATRHVLQPHNTPHMYLGLKHKHFTKKTTCYRPAPHPRATCQRLRPHPWSMPIQSFLRFFSVWVHRSYDVAVYRRCAISKKSVLRNISVLYFFSWQFTWCTLDVLSSRRLPHCSAIPLQWFHSSASCKRPDEMSKVSHSTSHWRIQGMGAGDPGQPLIFTPPPPCFTIW